MRGIDVRAMRPAAMLLIGLLGLAGQARATGYRIAGTVVNALTGEPVRGAAVAALTVEDSRSVASTETGENGRFAMDGLPAAKYQLTASRRGYCTGFYDQHDYYNTAIVTGEGQQTDNLVFRLTPGAVLSGVVTEDGGDAAEGATVMLFEKPHRHEPGEKIEEVDTAETDDTGAYEFGGLRPGEYLLAVKAQPWYAMNRPPGRAPETEAEAALDVAYPITFYDSTTEEGSATPIAIAGGDRVEANISLHAVPAVHLVVDEPVKQDGAVPRPDLQQTVFGMELPEGSEQVEMEAKAGKTEVSGLAPGHYEITVGEPPRVLELDAAGSSEVDAALGAPTVAVNGVVEAAAGATLTGQLAVTLTRADGADGRSAELSAAISGGTFTFPSVPAGAWELRVDGQGGTLPVMRVSAGGRTLAGDRVTVADRPLSLGVTVSASATRVEGFARRDGKAASGVLVALIPKQPGKTASLARRDQSDSDGSFGLLNVAPGDYTVVAIADGWDLDWSDPAVIGRYLPGGIAVTVKDGLDNRVQISEAVPVQER